MLIVVLVIIILLLAFLNIAYRQQIINISQQIEFITKNHTNKNITTNVNFREIEDLIANLNLLVAVQKQMNLDFSTKETELREAIANISHDIRTPLTSLNGYFQLLIDSEDQNDKDRYISIIQSRMEILKNLLDDMFTYIKIQDTSYKMKKESVNLNNIIQENLLSYYEEFNLKEIVPTINLPNKPILINTNEAYLNRIINNLISNSLIHGKSFVSVNVFNKDKTVNIVFENNAMHAKDIHIEDIFSRFYKNDYARTDNSTGLGLAIVKELVEKMDGEIIASVDGNVFKINISLPSI